VVFSIDAGDVVVGAQRDSIDGSWSVTDGKISSCALERLVLIERQQACVSSEQIGCKNPSPRKTCGAVEVLQG
jgi:hypothetical protein